MKDIVQNIKLQLKGGYLKFFFIILAVILAGTILEQLSSYYAAYTMLLPLFLVLSLCMPIVRNTIYFAFIKHQRNQSFNKQDIRFSVSKFSIQFIVSLLLMFIQYVVSTLLGSLTQNIYVLYLLITLLSQAVFAAASVIAAFAIYDGVDRTLELIKGTFSLLLRQGKSFLLLTIPYLIISLIIQMGLNFTLLQLIDGTEAITLVEVVTNALADPATSTLGMMVLAIYIMNILLNAALVVPMYMGYAYLYQKEYQNFFTIAKPAKTAKQARIAKQQKK